MVRRGHAMSHGGALVEVWTAAGSDPLAAWENAKPLRRVFDKDVKGYVVELAHAVGTSAKPPTLKGESGGCELLLRPCALTRVTHAVALLLPVLVLQVCVPASAVLSFELR